MSASNPTTQTATMPIPAADLRLESNLRWRDRQIQAVEDMVGACRLWRLAAALGWFDIRLRYRGSMLGPFWLTLSTAVMVAALGVLYSALFKMQLHDYLPYLALSLVLWNYLAALVGDACTCFTGGEAMIRAVRMPFMLYAARVVVRNTLVLAHNIVVIVAVYAYFDVWPGWRAVRPFPRHPAHRRQPDADRLLRQPDHLEAGAAHRRAARPAALQPVLQPAGAGALAAVRRHAGRHRVGVGAGL
jgi:lipopolysaccharide transport system permease protein